MELHKHEQVETISAKKGASQSVIGAERCRHWPRRSESIVVQDVLSLRSKCCRNGLSVKSDGRWSSLLLAFLSDGRVSMDGGLDRVCLLGRTCEAVGRLFYR